MSVTGREARGQGLEQSPPRARAIFPYTAAGVCPLHRGCALVQTTPDRANGRDGARLSVCRGCLAVVLLGTCLLVAGCASLLGSSAARSTQISSLGAGAAGGNPTGRQITEAELREDVVRFAKSSISTFTQALDQIQEGTDSRRIRLAAQRLKVRYGNALVDIATGPSPDANLLDAVAFANLARAAAERYWVPTVFGAAGEDLLLATKRVEAESFALASSVLSQEQMATLHVLIERWQAEHPDQIVVSGVRLESFAKEFSDEAMESLRQPAGLLPEVADASRSVDELRLLSERLMLFLQSAPGLLRLEAEVAAYELSEQPEVTDLIATTDRLGVAADQLTRSLQQLPELVTGERRAAIEQLVAKISSEREVLLAKLASGVGPTREMLGELRQTLAAANEFAAAVRTGFAEYDRVATHAGWSPDDPFSPPFEIRDYQQTFVELGRTAANLNTLVGSIDRALEASEEEGPPGRFPALVRDLDGTVKGWITRLALASIGVVTFALSGGVVAARLVRRRA